MGSRGQLRKRAGGALATATLAVAVGGIAATPAGADGPVAAAAGDTTLPTGVVTGPATGLVGELLSFSTSATDEFGGSGVDGNSYAWVAGGATGVGATFTAKFNAVGTHTVAGTFRDYAGNRGTATTTVTISRTRVTKVGVRAVKRKDRRGTAEVRFKGTITLPGGADRITCRVPMRMTLKVGRTVLTRAYVTGDATCSFQRLIPIQTSKLGSARKVTVQFASRGTSRVDSFTRTLRVKLPKG